MSKPTPKPIHPDELINLARAVIQADRFPVLATIDGDKPRVRPVSPVRTDGFTVYVANLRSYHKTGEIAANPNVELCYVDDGHNQVRLAGTAAIVTERPLLQQIWDTTPLLRQYLGTLDNPDKLLKPEMYATVQLSVEERRAMARDAADSAVRVTGDVFTCFIETTSSRWTVRDKSFQRNFGTT